MEDVIAVGRCLCEATQRLQVPFKDLCYQLKISNKRLQDMSVAANSARLVETIAWVVTVASGFGATDDMLLDLRL